MPKTTLLLLILQTFHSISNHPSVLHWLFVIVIKWFLSGYSVTIWTLGILFSSYQALPCLPLTLFRGGGYVQFCQKKSSGKIRKKSTPFFFLVLTTAKIGILEIFTSFQDMGKLIYDQFKEKRARMDSFWRISVERRGRKMSWIMDNQIKMDN